jgi:hypothetical protein
METFKVIEGYDNYEISDHGNVRNKKTGRILALYIARGYCQIKLYTDKKTKHFTIHRLVALTFLENLDNKKEVDHMNNNKLDNNLTNLRWVTKSENQHNKKISRNNTSGVKGISLNKRINKWRARIMINNKTVYLGIYRDLIDAENAVKEARIRLHGEYCNHG